MLFFGNLFQFLKSFWPHFIEHISLVIINI